MTYIIYHGNCFDGFTAAWVANLKFGTKALYIGWGTGQRNVFPLPEEKLADAEIYILDFSFPRDIIDRIKDKVKKIVIIDHHKTARDELSDYPFAVFDMSKSGALLTWEYFFPGLPVPKLVEYISDRDLWKFELPYSKEISAYIAAYKPIFDNWDIINVRLENKYQCSDIIAQGGMLLQNHEIVVESLCKHGVFEDSYCEGQYKFPTLNAPKQYGSDCCDYILKTTQAQACVYFLIEGKSICYGIRSKPEFDCSEVAKFYGGGGHAQASGWSIKLED